MKQIVIIISLSIVFLFVSCKTHTHCEVSDPLTELPWLASMIETEHVTISKAIFKDKEGKKKIEGFINLASWSVFYNCSGEEICAEGGIAGAKCERYEVVKSEIIYQCK